jgi:hypothetical protein
MLDSKHREFSADLKNENSVCLSGKKKFDEQIYQLWLHQIFACENSFLI